MSLQGTYEVYNEEDHCAWVLPSGSLILPYLDVPHISLREMPMPMSPASRNPELWFGHVDCFSFTLPPKTPIEEITAHLKPLSLFCSSPKWQQPSRSVPRVKEIFLEMPFDSLQYSKENSWVVFRHASSEPVKGGPR